MNLTRCLTRVLLHAIFVAVVVEAVSVGPYGPRDLDVPFKHAATLQVSSTLNKIIGLTTSEQQDHTYTNNLIGDTQPIEGARQYQGPTDNELNRLSGDEHKMDAVGCPTTIHTAEQYKTAYLLGCERSQALSEGLSDIGCVMHGRVITKASGAKEWDSRLSGSHPFRKVVWAVGADALSEYTYQHLHDPIRMLTELGWHKDEVLSMVEKGFEFQLIVWGGNDPATGQCDKSTDLNRATIPAAWPIAWQKVRKGYQQDGIELPFVTDQVLKKLHTTHFSELTGGGCKRHGSRWQCGSTEAQNAFNELKYGQAGLDYFLTLDRPSALQVRAFLCNVLQFDTLYTGLGYTQTDEGVLTHAYNWAEFLLYNREISTLPYAQRLPIHIYPDNFGVDR